VSPEPAPFEILEHTADAGVVARGRTLAEAFVHAAEGMFSIMVDLDGVREVEDFRPYALRAVAFGEQVDRQRHELGTGVKAITRHMLEVEEAPEGCRVQVLLDI